MLRFEHAEYLWFLLLIPALGHRFLLPKSLAKKTITKIYWRNTYFTTCTGSKPCNAHNKTSTHFACNCMFNSYCSKSTSWYTPRRSKTRRYRSICCLRCLFKHEIRRYSSEQIRKGQARCFGIVTKTFGRSGRYGRFCRRCVCTISAYG